MVLERFAILLENADGVYFPGQSVTGVVHVWNSQPKALKGFTTKNSALKYYFVILFVKHLIRCKGIYAECRGLARVHFTKEEGQWRTIRRNRRMRREFTNVTVHYQANEDYFYHRVPLFDHGPTTKQFPLIKTNRLIIGIHFRRRAV